MAKHRSSPPRCAGETDASVGRADIEPGLALSRLVRSLVFAERAFRFVESVRDRIPSSHEVPELGMRRPDLPGFPLDEIRSVTHRALELAKDLRDGDLPHCNESFWVEFDRGRTWFGTLFWPLVERWEWSDDLRIINTGGLSDETIFAAFNHLIFDSIGTQEICPYELAALGEALRLIGTSCRSGLRIAGKLPDPPADRNAWDSTFLAWLGVGARRKHDPNEPPPPDPRLTRTLELVNGRTAELVRYLAEREDRKAHFDDIARDIDKSRTPSLLRGRIRQRAQRARDALNDADAPLRIVILSSTVQLLNRP